MTGTRITRTAALISTLAAALLSVSCAVFPFTETAAPDLRTAPGSPVHDPLRQVSEDTQNQQSPTDVTDPAETDEPPVFIYLTGSVTIERGDTFNVHKYIAYADDLDPDVELSVTGEVDIYTDGKYPLLLTIRDDTGNETSTTITVNVVESIPATPYVPPELDDFSLIASRYRKDGAMVGIDVSRWQGYVDFEKVAAAGCEFVIIRIGGYSDELFTDTRYRDNIRDAKKAGLKVGVYWYSEESGAEHVRRDAAYLYGELENTPLDFPVFFDWEDYVNFENYKMSLRDLNEMFLAFKEEASARGYSAALYNSKYYLDTLWSDEAKKGGVWLAHYIDETNYGGDYFLWQQGVASINGIDGAVDVNIFYPDRMS